MKGYMSAPDTQKIIWDYVFGPECMAINPSETNLLVTEPVLNFVSNQEIMCELLFEEYEFHAVCRSTGKYWRELR